MKKKTIKKLANFFVNLMQDQKYKLTNFSTWNVNFLNRKKIPVLLKNRHPKIGKKNKKIK